MRSRAGSGCCRYCEPGLAAVAAYAWISSQAPSLSKNSTLAVARVIPGAVSSIRCRANSIDSNLAKKTSLGLEVTFRLLSKSSAVVTRKHSNSRLVRQQPSFVESVYDHWNLALMERGYGIAFVGGLQIGQQSVERSGRNRDFSQIEDRRLKCRRHLSRQRALTDRRRRFDENNLLLDDRWVLPLNIQSWRYEWTWWLRDEEASSLANLREMDGAAQHVNEYVQRNFRHKWPLRAKAARLQFRGLWFNGCWLYHRLTFVTRDTFEISRRSRTQRRQATRRCWRRCAALYRA